MNSENIKYLTDTEQYLGSKRSFDVTGDKKIKFLMRIVLGFFRETEPIFNAIHTHTHTHTHTHM